MGVLWKDGMISLARAHSLRTMSLAILHCKSKIPVSRHTNSWVQILINWYCKRRMEGGGLHWWEKVGIHFSANWQQLKTWDAKGAPWNAQRSFQRRFLEFDNVVSADNNNARYLNKHRSHIEDERKWLEMSPTISWCVWQRGGGAVLSFSHMWNEAAPNGSEPIIWDLV